jgi:hypothetical protein
MNEFRNYAINHVGLNGLTTDDVIKHQIKASMTPMIVEEREMRAL